MEKHLIDIEVFPNFYFLGIKDFTTKEIASYEVSAYKDQRLELYIYLTNFSGYLISFNGKHYDEVVNNFIVVNWHHLKDCTTSEFCTRVKEFSDYVIQDEYEKIKSYKYIKNIYTSIDLYMFWAKSLRISKKISLKGLAIQMGWPHIQELPYPHNTTLTLTQMIKVTAYNLDNDLGILERLMEQFLGEGTIPLGDLGTIHLRHQIKQRYGLDCYSWDAPKIASEAIIKEYCNKKNLDINEFKKIRYVKEDFYFGELFNQINVSFKTPLFRKLYLRWYNSRSEFSEEFVAFTDDDSLGIKISVGVGGIHSVNKNEIYERDDEYEIYDLDIASLYPQLILNYNCFRFKELNEIYDHFRLLRINKSKPNMKKYKGTDKEQFWKNEDLFYKVILNGISGYLDMAYSPLYNNKGAMTMRCAGQLILLYLTEIVLEENIRVIQLNTDGITVKILKDKIPWLKEEVTKIEKKFNVVFEEQYYKKIVLQNVNSYLAIDLDGKVKEKGEFVRNPALGNSVDSLVIAKALVAYFTDGILPDTFIINHSNILDFCMSMKIDKSYTVKWTNGIGDTIVCQNLNRFYASTYNGYIKKHRGESEYNLLTESGVTLYNIDTYVFPQDVNYKYYIRKTLEKIQRLEKDKKQFKLF